MASQCDHNLRVYAFRVKTISRSFPGIWRRDTKISRPKDWVSHRNAQSSMTGGRLSSTEDASFATCLRDPFGLCGMMKLKFS